MSPAKEASLRLDLQDLLDENLLYLNAIGTSLLTVQGKLGGSSNVSFLLDTAASTVYASRRLAQQFPQFQVELPERQVQLANGQKMTSTQGLRIPYSIGNFNSQLEARVLDLEGHNIILGLTWFREWNPSLDFRNDKMYI